MPPSEPNVRIVAASLLRGDLAGILPPESAARVDAQLHAVLVDAAADPASAAVEITMITAADARLRARLGAFERDLTADALRHGEAHRGLDGPPGNPGPVQAQIWTCPADPAGHFRKRRRYPNEPMGACTTHGFPLEPESGGTAR